MQGTIEDINVKLTIFAATGGIGRQLLEQAVAAGHDVTAVVRNPHPLLSTQARVVVADLAAARTRRRFSPRSHGADAVLSGLGARTKADAGVRGVFAGLMSATVRASGALAPGVGCPGTGQGRGMLRRLQHASIFRA